jgi:hypothetical protein
MPDKQANGSSDDAKARFREALERKRTSQAERAAETHGESKIHEARGAAGGKRTFRRKSG